MSVVNTQNSNTNKNLHYDFHNNINQAGESKEFIDNAEKIFEKCKNPIILDFFKTVMEKLQEIEKHDPLFFKEGPITEAVYTKCLSIYDEIREKFSIITIKDKETIKTSIIMDDINKYPATRSVASRLINNNLEIIATKIISNKKLRDFFSKIGEAKVKESNNSAANCLSAIRPLAQQALNMAVIKAFFLSSPRYEEVVEERIIEYKKIMIEARSN